MQDQTKGILTYLLKSIFNLLLTAAVLFLAAGRFDWLAAWALIGMIFATQAFMFIALYRISPDLLAERSTAQVGSKKWDIVLAIVIAMVLPLVMWAIAGLDERFGASPALPLKMQAIAAVLFVSGSLFIIWAMASNRFFSGLVRIQANRGHKVASSGPYGFIRHPGYIGMIITFTVAPIVLGSLWALVPALLIDVLLVVRTALEDKTLQKELPGYADYLKNVKYRLIPYVW